MNFASIRIITADIKALVLFYEKILGVPAEWSTPEFAELRTDAATIAIGSTKTLAFFGEGVAAAASNRSVILEFLVRDVDADFKRIGDAEPTIVQEPTTMPWGNRSLLIRDPDGNLVNFFTPVSDAAKRKHGR